MLKGNTDLCSHLQGAFEIVRSLPHGHVAAVLAMMRQFKVDQLLQAEPPRARALALIAQRVLQPGSKLATALATLFPRDHLSHQFPLNIRSASLPDSLE